MLEQILVQISGKSYPFGQQIHSKLIFAEYVFQTANKNQSVKLKDNLYILKEINHPNIIELLRVSRKEQHASLIYQYYGNSLLMAVERQKNNQSCKIQCSQIRQALSSVCQFLTANSVKVSLSLENTAFDSESKIQIFLSPDFDICVNQEALEKHYKAESSIFMAKLLKHFYTGRTLQKNLKNTMRPKVQQQISTAPRNFIIKGNKLVFNLNNNSEIEQEQAEIQDFKNFREGFEKRKSNAKLLQHKYRQSLATPLRSPIDEEIHPKIKKWSENLKANNNIQRQTISPVSSKYLQETHTYGQTIKQCRVNGMSDMDEVVTIKVKTCQQIEICVDCGERYQQCLEDWETPQQRHQGIQSLQASMVLEEVLDNFVYNDPSEHIVKARSTIDSSSSVTRNILLGANSGRARKSKNLACETDFPHQKSCSSQADTLKFNQRLTMPIRSSEQSRPFF